MDCLTHSNKRDNLQNRFRSVLRESMRISMWTLNLHLNSFCQKKIKLNEKSLKAVNFFPNNNNHTQKMNIINLLFQFILKVQIYIPLYV